MSLSPPSLRRDFVPGNVRTGLTFAYSCKGLRIASRRPHNEMWSGTSIKIVTCKLSRAILKLTWSSNRAEESCVVASQHTENIIIDIFAGLLVVGSTPRYMSKLNFKCLQHCCKLLHNLYRRSDHFDTCVGQLIDAHKLHKGARYTNAVRWYRCDAVFGHV